MNFDQYFVAVDPFKVEHLSRAAAAFGNIDAVIATGFSFQTVPASATDIVVACQAPC